MTRLSEHILRVTDVLCFSAVTIRNLVQVWLDAEELEARPSHSWVKRLLRGMHLSYKKPAKCVKELHSPEQQHANTHRLFIKLCWLMSAHAVSADRAVNIDETSCRLLPVHQIGWGRRGVKQAQLQGNEWSEDHLQWAHHCRRRLLLRDLSSTPLDRVGHCSGSLCSAGGRASTQGPSVPEVLVHVSQLAAEGCPQ